MTALIGFGAGGHSRVLLEILALEKRYQFTGLLDTNVALHGASVSGVPVLGGDELIPTFVARRILHAYMGVGSVSGTQPRQRIFEQAKAHGLQFVGITHPNAVIAPSAILGEGCAVLAGAIVGTGAHLADNVIVNTRAVVEHDCRIGSHVHIASGAVLAGDVTVGEGTHIGAGAVVRQGLRIGCGAVVGVGAAVIRDVPDGVTVVGVPARLLIR